MPAYIAAQATGATLGTWAIVGVLGHKAVDVGLGIGVLRPSPSPSPSPSPGASAGRAFLAEAVGTAILVFIVFGVPVDARAATPSTPTASSIAVSSEGVPA